MHPSCCANEYNLHVSNRCMTAMVTNVSIVNLAEKRCDLETFVSAGSRQRQLTNAKYYLITYG